MNETIQETWIVKTLNKWINRGVTLLLITLLLYGGAALWDIYSQYQRSSLDAGLTHLKPGEPDYDFSDLLAINPDVCGWLTLDGTNIDYPVLQGKDNAEYLERDIYRKYYIGGSIFLDYRNKKDFTDSYNLIHGHHMDGGAMFGDLGNFDKKSYFEAHDTGTLYTPRTRYQLEVFAYLKIDAYDSMIYNPQDKDTQGQKELLSYIKKNALHYRKIGVKASDQILAMSTCSSAFTDSRSVVVAKLTEIGKNSEGEVKNAKDQLDEQSK